MCKPVRTAVVPRKAGCDGKWQSGEDNAVLSRSAVKSILRNRKRQTWRKPGTQSYGPVLSVLSS